MYKKKFAKWQWNKYGHKTTAGKRTCVRNRHAQETQRLIALHHETCSDRLIESALKEVRDFVISLSGKTSHCRTNSDWEGLLYIDSFFALDPFYSILWRAIQAPHPGRNFKLTVNILQRYSSQDPMSICAVRIYARRVGAQTKPHRNEHPIHFISSAIRHLIDTQPELVSRYLRQGALLYEDILGLRGVGVRLKLVGGEPEVDKATRFSETNPKSIEFLPPISSVPVGWSGASEPFENTGQHRTLRRLIYKMSFHSR